MKRLLLLPLVTCVLLSLAPVSAWAAAFPSPLITADWLVEHRDGVHMLDVRKDLESFMEEGHMEGAVLVNSKDVRIQREVDGKKLTRMRQDAASFQAFMRRLGVNNNSQVVITHRGETPGQLAGAARLYWQMKLFGFDKVALLDGGNAAWVAALEDLVSEVAEVTPGDYTVGKEHHEIVATMPQVQQAVKTSSDTLVDTRDLRYHVGIDKKDYVFAYGHIPGSRLLPYKFLNPAKGAAVYFPKDALRQTLAALHIPEDKPLILYCNSAYECSSVWFALHEIIGKQDVRIYDGSLHQWTQYPDNPMTRELTR